MSALKGVEIREGHLLKESDTDSDGSDTVVPHQIVDPNASTSKESERLSKMEIKLADLKKLISKLVPQAQSSDPSPVKSPSLP